MATEFEKSFKEMSVEELESAIDRLCAVKDDSNPQTRQYREDTIAQLTEEIHRRRGTENI